MLFNLTTPTANQLAFAKSGEIGNESQDVRFTREEFLHMGFIEVNGATTTSFEYLPSPGLDLGAAGRDLHLRCNNGVVGDQVGDVSVQLNVTYADDATGTSTATLIVPTWADDQDKVYHEGWATDFLPDDNANDGKKIKSIQSVAAVNNTVSGNEFAIIASPNADKFHRIGCATSKDGVNNVPGSFAIACGYDGTRWVKPARSEEAKLTLGWKYRSGALDLNRYNGMRVGVQINTVKNRSVPWETRVYTGHQVTVSDPKGEGNDEVAATSDGLYEDFMIFYAANAAA